MGVLHLKNFVHEQVAAMFPQNIKILLNSNLIVSSDMVFPTYRVMSTCSRFHFDSIIFFYIVLFINL